VVNGCLQLVDVQRGGSSPLKIEDLAQRFVEALRSIIAHCQSQAGASPSDFPLAQLSQDELDEALNG